MTTWFKWLLMPSAASSAESKFLRTVLVSCREPEVISSLVKIQPVVSVWTPMVLPVRSCQVK